MLEQKRSLVRNNSKPMDFNIINRVHRTKMDSVIYFWHNEFSVRDSRTCNVWNNCQQSTHYIEQYRREQCLSNSKSNRRKFRADNVNSVRWKRWQVKCYLLRRMSRCARSKFRRWTELLAFLMKSAFFRASIFRFSTKAPNDFIVKEWHYHPATS